MTGGGGDSITGRIARLRPIARIAERVLDNQADPPASALDEPDESGAPDVEQFRQFLYREARLLDERRWEEWLDLWVSDLSYSMPTRQNVQPQSPERSIADELADDDGTYWFDETRDTLEIRVAKLRTGKAWGEEPPSRTRRYVGNVEVEEADGAGAIVRSGLLVYRGRRDCDVEWFSCGRTDRIVIEDGGFKLAARRVVIDTNVVAADNLIVFF